MISKALTILVVLFGCTVLAQEGMIQQANSCSGYASSCQGSYQAGCRGTTRRRGLFRRIALRRGMRLQARRARLTRLNQARVNYAAGCSGSRQTASPAVVYNTPPQSSPITYAAPSNQVMSTPPQRYYLTNCSNGVCTVQQVPPIPSY